MGLSMVLAIGVLLAINPSHAQAAPCGSPVAPVTGVGTSADPYQIATKENLIWVSIETGPGNTDATDRQAKLTAHYRQTEDINLQGCDWAPIGIVGGNPFSGSYNGEGKKIQGFSITNPTGYAGLFGYVSGNQVKISDIELEGTLSGNSTDDVSKGALVAYLAIGEIDNVTSRVTVNVTGSTAVSGVGGLVGSMNDRDGIVKNSVAHGDVTGPGNHTGGLVGAQAFGDIRNSGAMGAVTGVFGVGGLVGFSGGAAAVTIVDSFARGNVTSIGEAAGGLVGVTFGSSTINRSVAAGNVVGDLSVGGFVGSIRGRTVISDSYATGTVDATATTGNGNSGGLIGLVSHSGTASSIARSYARGEVNGRSPIGGLIGGVDTSGGNTTPTVTASFWDETTTGLPTSAENLGEPKNTILMTSFATFGPAPGAAWAVVDSWDSFDANNNKVWGICDSTSVNGGYPFLLWEYASDPCTADNQSSGSGGSNTQANTSSAGPELAPTGSDAQTLALVGALALITAGLLGLVVVRSRHSDR